MSKYDKEGEGGREGLIRGLEYVIIIIFKIVLSRMHDEKFVLVWMNIFRCRAEQSKAEQIRVVRGKAGVIGHRVARCCCYCRRERTYVPMSDVRMRGLLPSNSS